MMWFVIVGVVSIAVGIWLGMAIVLAGDVRLSGNSSSDLEFWGANDFATAEKVWLSPGDRVRFFSRMGTVRAVSADRHRASVLWDGGNHPLWPESEVLSQSLLTRCKAKTP